MLFGKIIVETRYMLAEGWCISALTILSLMVNQEPGVETHN